MIDADRDTLATYLAAIRNVPVSLIDQRLAELTDAIDALESERTELLQAKLNYFGRREPVLATDMDREPIPKAQVAELIDAQLSEGPKRVAELAEATGISPQRIGQVLNANRAKYEKLADGRWVRTEFNPARMAD